MNIYVNGEGSLCASRTYDGVGKRVSIGGSDANLADELLSVEGTSRFEGDATFEKQVVTGPLRNFDENETARIKSERTSGDVLTVWGGASSMGDGNKVIGLKGDGNANFVGKITSASTNQKATLERPLPPKIMSMPTVVVVGLTPLASSRSPRTRRRLARRLSAIITSK